MSEPIKITVTGPQGAGKTTLIMNLLAVLEATEFQHSVELHETNQRVEMPEGGVLYFFVPGEKP
jgi:GTPase SAR1 family protein